jgi:hypothetical protein
LTSYAAGIARNAALVPPGLDDTFPVLHNHQGRVGAREDTRIAWLGHCSPQIIKLGSCLFDLVCRDPFAFDRGLRRFRLNRAFGIRQPCSLFEEILLKLGDLLRIEAIDQRLDFMCFGHCGFGEGISTPLGIFALLPCDHSKESCVNSSRDIFAPNILTYLQ